MVDVVVVLYPAVCQLSPMQLPHLLAVQVLKLFVALVVVVKIWGSCWKQLFLLL